MSMLAPTESEYAAFKRAVGPLLPVRLDDYKQAQMERRIRDLARKHRAPDLGSYVKMISADAGLLRELEQHITINVSEFFRNPEAFDYLGKQILPRLLAARQGVEAWSAGCSYGAEPYSLAMLFHDAAPALKHAIHATDIDKAILDRARLGNGFSADDVKSVPVRLRDRYLSRQGPPYSVAVDVQRMVRFDRYDLLHDRMARTFDLIACRNVVIYFTDEAKLKLFSTFAAALRPGGYLFIGATEVISAHDGLGLRYVAPCFYQKAA